MKTYRICKVDNLSQLETSWQPTPLNTQLTMEGVDPPPLTTLIKEKSATPLIPFDCYSIEHEKIESASGRTGSVLFHSYIHRFDLKAYHEPKSPYFIIQGRKKAINDLLRAEVFLSLTPMFINLNRLQNSIQQLHMIWFRFFQGQFSSTSFRGSNIKDVIDKQQLFRHGHISTMSFSLPFHDQKISLQVSHEASFVIQTPFQDFDSEMTFIDDFFHKLLAPCLQVTDPIEENRPELSTDEDDDAYENFDSI